MPRMLQTDSAPPVSAAPGRRLAWVLFVGSSVHVASTGWLYTLGDVRSYAASRSLRFWWVPAALVLAGGLAAALLSPISFTWLLLPFFGWQFFHFAKQNLGMVALAASSASVPSPRTAERRTLLAAGVAGIGGLMAHPALLQLRVDPRLGMLFPWRRSSSRRPSLLAWPCSRGGRPHSGRPVSA
jgi:hypothetical protein